LVFEDLLVERLRHQADAAAEHGRTFSVRVVREPYSGPEIYWITVDRFERIAQRSEIEILVMVPVGVQPVQIVEAGRIRWIRWHGHVVTVIVVPKAKVDHERGGDAPVILDEESKILGVVPEIVQRERHRDLTGIVGEQVRERIETDGRRFFAGATP